MNRELTIECGALIANKMSQHYPLALYKRESCSRDRPTLLDRLQCKFSHLHTEQILQYFLCDLIDVCWSPKEQKNRNLYDYINHKSRAIHKQVQRNAVL